MSDNWISVKDRLPETNEEFYYYKSSKCVLACNSTHIFVAYLVVDDEYGSKWIQFGRDGYEADDITHWMSLPKFPSGA